MMVFIGDFVVIGGIQEMRYTTSMVPNNSTELAMENRSSIQDALLLNTSYMSPDIVFKLRSSPETNRVLNTGNPSELQQVISTITLDERPRDVSMNRFDRSTDTTTTDIFKHNSSLNPKTEIKELVSLDLCRQYSSCEHVSNMTFKICHCDALCILYNDCCYNADIPDDSTVSKDLLFDCISPMLTSPWTANKGYQVVKTCPKDLINTEIDIKCQSDDIFLFGPWVITDSNIVFKNRFCAKCNNTSNYKSFDIKFTNAEDTAKKNTPSIVLAALQDIYKERVQNSLVVEFLPPVAANLRQCVVYRNPKNESKNCLIYYTSPVIVKTNRDSSIVRNAFCIHPEDNVRGCVGQVGMLDSLAIGWMEVYDIFPMTVLFQFQQSCKGEFDVNGICLAGSYEKYIEQDYSLVSSTNLSRIMVEEILTIMALSFSDEIIPRKLMYSYKVEKIDNLFYVKNVSITGKVIGKVSYEESINIDNHLKEANWLIRVSPKNGLTYEVNAMFVKKNDKWHSTGFNFNSRLNQLKADLKNNSEKKLCAKSIIDCETWRDSDNPRTVIKDLTCVDFIQMQPTFASTNINMNVIT
ncbi:Hypothetical predicted protein [Mytilus galloprovincialis]|uniref:SMB domain-containing protein n=1 Tax=Mytilus galloprovincialis TaxID=29158 RepID=A0A8B6EE97_MYTGA|nr:Hypothetical predicted protein [Mytilus galloprovincialis]